MRGIRIVMSLRSRVAHWLNRGILGLLGIVLMLLGAGVLDWGLASAPFGALGRVAALATAIGLLTGGLRQLHRAATGRFPAWYSHLVLYVGGAGASGGPKDR